VPVSEKASGPPPPPPAVQAQGSGGRGCADYRLPRQIRCGKTKLRGKQTSLSAVQNVEIDGEKRRDVRRSFQVVRVAEQ